jgi:hypothetical protein
MWSTPISPACAPRRGRSGSQFDAAIERVQVHIGDIAAEIFGCDTDVQDVLGPLHTVPLISWSASVIAR